MHDIFLLGGMAAADILIIVTWWFLGSRLVPAERAPESSNGEMEKGVRALHRILTFICFFLLIGLIVECTAMVPAILVRYGWS